MAKCRLCYSDTNPILAEYIFNEKLDPPIWKLIADLTKITIIKNDPYTKIVCLECFEQLRKCDIFRRMILQTDWRIRHDNETITTDSHPSVIKEEPTEHDNDDIEGETNEHCTNDGDDSRCSIETTTKPEIITVDTAQIVENIRNNFNDFDGYSPIKRENENDDSQTSQDNANKSIDADDDTSIDDQNQLNTPEKQPEHHHPCEICNKAFLTKTSLKIHLKIHRDNRPYRCEICNKGFTLKHNLKEHLNVHSGEKPYHCGICGKEFAHTCNLRRHLKTHTGEKPFHCEICNKQFTQNHHLKDHMKIHTGEKPYDCHSCCKKFSGKTQLKRHLKVHTGEKPFNCELCGKRFASKYNLKDHLKVHTGERPHHCDMCGKRFALKSHLRRHLKLHN